MYHDKKFIKKDTYNHLNNLWSVMPCIILLKKAVLNLSKPWYAYVRTYN